MNHKIFYSIFILIIFIVFMGLSNAAKTVIGYLNGQQVVMAVASNDRTGTLMITTNIIDAQWDNLIESTQGYTEDWQTHPAGPPADWTATQATNGAAAFVVTGANNYLQATALGPATNSRITYNLGTSWAPPHDFTVTATIGGTTSTAPDTGSRIRMGVGATGDGLPSYQIFIYQPFDYLLSNGVNCYGAFHLRDAQANIIDIWNFSTTSTSFVSYDGMTTGAQLTLRITSRDPNPVYFTDSTRVPVTVISTTGCYVTVEDASLVNYAASGTWNTSSVLIVTDSGDSELINVGETFPNASILFNIDRQPLPVSNNTPIPNNGILEGLAGSTAYVYYSSNTATAIMPALPIDVTPDGYNITVGQTLLFTATGGSPPYTWSVGNPSIGSIDSTSGLFTALAAGTTTVTATDTMAQTDSATVYVIPTSASLTNDIPYCIIHDRKMIWFESLK